MSATHETTRDAEIDTLAETLMDAAAKARKDKLEGVLRAVEETDCYRETVQSALKERGTFLDPLNLCPDLDPANA